MTINSGRCWKLGDSVSNDQLMASKWVFDYELAILTKNILVDLIPQFAAEAKAGDYIVAGENFAHGSLHIHPFLALKEMGIGIISKSMPRGAFRLAIYAGVTLLTNCGDACDAFNDGDRISVDPMSGTLRNLSRKAELSVRPLPTFLADIIAAGGGVGYIKKTIAASHPG